MSRGFRLDHFSGPLRIRIIRDIFEGRFDLCGYASHQEFSWRDEAELHADAVRVLNRHAEMLGPRFLMRERLSGVKRSYCRLGEKILWRRQSVISRRGSGVIFPDRG